MTGNKEKPKAKSEYCGTFIMLYSLNLNYLFLMKCTKYAHFQGNSYCVSMGVHVRGKVMKVEGEYGMKYGEDERQG